MTVHQNLHVVREHHKTTSCTKRPASLSYNIEKRLVLEAPSPTDNPNLDGVFGTTHCTWTHNTTYVAAYMRIASGGA
eukprot:5289930-Prorocentrum_lima.AAC.1